MVFLNGQVFREGGATPHDHPCTTDAVNPFTTDPDDPFTTDRNIRALRMENSPSTTDSKVHPYTMDEKLES